MNKFAFFDCRTVDEALGQLSDGATIKAGGIDLLDLMKDNIVAPSKLVNIRNVSSLRGITAGKDGLHLGPLSTLSEIAAHPDIQQSYAALADAASHAATARYATWCESRTRTGSSLQFHGICRCPRP